MAPGDQATPPPSPAGAAARTESIPQRVVVPYALGMAPGDPGTATDPPPLPDGYNPADYYWCDKCKAYHRRPQQ